MNLPTILLLACLLCAEAPAGTPMERYLIAQTVVYRAEFSGMTVEEIIHAPDQYPGVDLIDLEAYRLYRSDELAENLRIAQMALSYPPMKVSNFARTRSCYYDRPCEWESRCELVAQRGTHTFYLCSNWEAEP